MRASLQRKTGRSGAQREQSSAGDAPPDGEAGQCRLLLPTLKWGGSKGAQVPLLFSLVWTLLCEFESHWSGKTRWLVDGERV